MHDSRQCAYKVGEPVYHLQSLTFHCNGGLLERLARCWLINLLGLFDADCEVIAVTGARYLIYTFFASSLLLEHSLPCHDLFVCVEVLRPSQSNGVMSSAFSLSNHTFTGQA